MFKTWCHKWHRYITPLKIEQLRVRDVRSRAATMFVLLTSFIFYIKFYKMATHLENLEKILIFIAKETFANKIIDTLYKNIKCMVEQHITLRDLENFIAYFKFVLSTSRIPKKFKFEPKLVQAFIHRTYAECTDKTQTARGKTLYQYLKHKIDPGAEIGTTHLKLLAKSLLQERKHSLERLTERVRIAMILKWLQGPLEDQLSKALKDYIIFLATIYGQYSTNRVFNVDWHAYEVSKKDMALLNKEYKVFDDAINGAVQLIRQARIKSVTSQEYQEQFRVVIDCLDNLIKMKEEGEITPDDSFKDKIVVSTSLIYIQDEFVKKDTELNKFIRLLVSLYRQFRDKHYTTVARKSVGK